MAMDIEKICRTCLALSGPLLSIYDGGTFKESCIADMLANFTKMKPKPTDNMPQKVCLSCISEITRCFSFKMKCENSNRALRQLLPNAVPEEISPIFIKSDKITASENKYVQTTPQRSVLTKVANVQTCEELLLTAVKDLELENSKWPKSSNLQLPITRAHLKRKATSTSNNQQSNHSTDTGKKVLKRNYVESFQINSEDEEFIVELESTSPSMPQEKKPLISEEIIVDGTSNEVETPSIYQITNENFVCEGYEIEPVASDEKEEEGNDSENAVFIDTKNTAGSNKSESNFIIVKSVLSLDVDQDTTKSKKEFGCTECNMTFFSLKVLRRHYLKFHYVKADENNFIQVKYRILNQSSQNDANETQVTNVQENDEMKSDEVDDNNSFSSQQNLDENSKHKFFCNQCKSNFSSKRSLNYHLKRNICNSQSYECDQCERVFASADKLESHKATHSTAAITCLECSKTFKSQEALSEHLINVHNRNARNQCNICKKVFTMLSTLKDHLRTHSGERPYLCTLCGKAFTQSANLKQHLRRHEQNKKFKCDECPNSYVTKAELFSHKRRHTGDQPFKCEFCDSTFTTSCSLVKHRRRHTGERPYACDICPMRFAVLNVLKNHRRLHTGEKPYKCPHCNKRFTQRGDCMIHINKHIDKNIYVCLCGKDFPTIEKLRTHSKRCQEAESNDDKVMDVTVADENVTELTYESEIDGIVQNN